MAELWLHYVEMARVPAYNQKSAKRAFYAGGAGMVHIMSQIDDGKDEEEAKAIAVELGRFSDDVVAGRE